MESNVTGYLRNVISRNYNEFMYTWVIENYKVCYHRSAHAKVVSPIIKLRNRDDKYEFQLKIYSCCAIGFLCFLRAEIETLLCPDNQSKALIRLCILSNNGAEHEPKESISSISRGKSCFVYDTNSSKVSDSCLFDGHLTVQFKITLFNDISHESDKAVLGTVAAASSKNSILDQYEELLNSAKLSDVTIVVGDKKFPAHKAILASRSPVFSAMFEHEMLENKKNVVEISDVHPEIMAEVLRFIYADKVNNIKETAADLLVVADKYQLESLRLMCEEILVEKLNIDNVAEMLKIVDRYASCRRLRDSVMKFLTANGRKVASLQNCDKIFEALSPALVIEVTKAFMMRA